MRTLELIHYSRRRLNGKRREIFLICSLPLGAELLFRAVESALYSLLLYFGTFQPISLFTGENAEQLGVSAVFALLRLTVCPPLWCAAAVRLREFTEDSRRRTSFSKMLLSGRFIRRSVSAAIFARFIAALALVPGLISAYIAADILSSGADSSGIFIASNALALTVVSAVMWFKIRLTITAVPWILAAHPEKGGFSAVIAAFRFMRGRRTLPLKLGLAYFFAAVTVVGIPFIIPEFAASFAQGLSIFMKEDEYAGEPVKVRRRFFRKIRE